MTELQKLLLKLQNLKDAQKAAFAEYSDVAAIPAERLKEIETRNTDIKAADAEIERLTKLEEMKAMSAPAAKATHHATENTKAGDDFDTKRQKEVRRVESLPRYGDVKNFKGPDAKLKAYQAGMWFLATVVNEKHSSPLTQKAIEYCKEWGLLESKAMSESVNTAGGFLVPPDFGNTIIDLREQYGVFRRNVEVVPMMSDTKSEPRRVSGLTVYYPGEGVAATASDLAFDAINLVAKKYAILSVWSSELNEDAIVDMGNRLAGEIAYQFSYAEDLNGFSGDGTSTYCRTTGVRQRLVDVFTTSGGTGLIKQATGTTWGAIVLADFHNVLAALPQYPRAGAKWFCSTAFYDGVMVKLQIAAGGNNVSDIANGGQPRFLGYPVEFSQVFPVATASAAVPAVFGNLRMAAMLGDRRSLTLAYSSEYKFAEDQLAIRGTQRIDINVHDVGASGTAGPIVGLITG